MFTKSMNKREERVMTRFEEDRFVDCWECQTPLIWRGDGDGSWSRWYCPTCDETTYVEDVY